IHFAFTLSLPVLFSPALLPLGVEGVLDFAGLRHGLPVALVLSVAMCAAVVFLYRLALNAEGSLLQAREQQILNTVTSKVE
ncbi:MAG TPA: hypothetical protein VH120_04140, partial [Gemmataceae bacterium]|nr:hypothetical protein [Gemmataceae bacterium]